MGLAAACLAEADRGWDPADESLESKGMYAPWIHANDLDANMH